VFAGEITMRKQTKSSSIRIIAGQWRGRRLPVKNSPGLRPTTDRVRETVFNWLAPYMYNARCLDLFAGSGALGIESLSRGAKFVQLVEWDKTVGAGIKACLDSLVTSNNFHAADIVVTDAMWFVSQAAVEPFDIVFLDPPFGSSMLEQAASALEQNGWLGFGALIYVEHDVDHSPPKLPANWRQIKRAKAGQCAYFLLQRQVG